MISAYNSSVIAAHLLIMAGSMVQGSLGFGLAVVVSPIFMLVDPRLVPVTLLINALAISIWHSWSLRRHIVWRELVSAFVGRIPGSLAAVYLLSHVPQRTLAFIVGGSVLLAVMVSLGRFEIPRNRVSAVIAGFFSGLMGTSSGIGGPPMALLYQKVERDKARANLSFYFVLSCIISLLLLAQAHRVDQQVFQLSLSMIPAALVGTWLARYPLRLVNRRVFQLGILSLCSIAALTVIVNALTMGG